MITVKLWAAIAWNTEKKLNRRGTVESGRLVQVKDARAADKL